MEGMLNVFSDSSSLCIAGKDYCIVASDTRQSDGYLINSRKSPKSFMLNKTCAIALNGFRADGLQLTKELITDIKSYEFSHTKTTSIESIAQLVSTKLYYKRFFPYYTFTLLGGIDSEGKGAVYSFDPVGSYEREQYRAGGSAASLIQPFLDSRIGQKNQTFDKADVDFETALAVAKEAFHGAAERDIYTGDYLQIFIFTKDGVSTELTDLRKD